MAEIHNYTLNFGCDITCRRQVSLRHNKPLRGVLWPENGIGC